MAYSNLTVIISRVKVIPSNPTMIYSNFRTTIHLANAVSPLDFTPCHAPTSECHALTPGHASTHPAPKKQSPPPQHDTNVANLTNGGQTCQMTPGPKLTTPGLIIIPVNSDPWGMVQAPGLIPVACVITLA